MENLIEAMGNDDLEALKLKYKDNPSVVTLVDNVLNVRKEAENKAKAKATFEASIKKIKLPTPPEDVHNIYIRWGEVEIANPVEGQPALKQMQWIVEVNHADEVKAGKGTSSSTSTKRGITVKHIDNDKLTLIGNFRTASEACGFLKLEVGGDAATRVLDRNGYIHEAYTGTDFTIKK